MEKRKRYYGRYLTQRKMALDGERKPLCLETEKMLVIVQKAGLHSTTLGLNGYFSEKN